MSNRNPQVDAWFADRDGPMTEAMQLARKLILDADHRVEETIKWKTPTFSYRGNIVSFNPSKKLVSLLFHRGAMERSHWHRCPHRPRAFRAEPET